MYKLFTLAALASVVVAAPGHGGGGSQCNTGPVQCCNTISNSSDKSTASLLGLLGIVAQEVNVPIGLTCNPISVIGIGGNSCSQQAVCCENNNFSGVVAIGCTPVNLSL